MNEQWRDAAADQPSTDAEIEAYYSRIATRTHIPTERCHERDSILTTDGNGEYCQRRGETLA